MGLSFPYNTLKKEYPLVAFQLLIHKSKLRRSSADRRIQAANLRLTVTVFKWPWMMDQVSLCPLIIILFIHR